MLELLIDALKISKKKTISKIASVGRGYKVLCYPILLFLVVFIFVYDFVLCLCEHIHMKEKFAKVVAVTMCAAILITSVDLAAYAFTDNVDESGTVIEETVVDTQGDVEEVTQTITEEASENDSAKTDASGIAAPEEEVQAVVEPTTEVEATETIETFEQSVTVDDAVITVTADAGVFPEGAKVAARKVSSSEEDIVSEAIDQVRDEDSNVAVSYTYDITAYDKDGNEIQPDTDKGAVKVSFKMPEIANENLQTEVYHIEETETGLEAVDLDVDTEEGAADEAVAETTGFSYYTVEFTYKGLQYVLNGDEKVALSTILETVGIEENGDVTGVESSNPKLFNPAQESGVWYVEALQAFDTEEWLKVTIGEIQYVIVVTDTSGSVKFEHMDVSSGFNAGLVVPAGATNTQIANANIYRGYSGTQSWSTYGGIATKGYVKQYKDSVTAERQGIPDDGLITDMNNSALSWQLAPFTAGTKNGLQLNKDNKTGTIAFSKVGCYQKMWFLAVAYYVGGRDPLSQEKLKATENIKVTIHYTDGTSNWKEVDLPHMFCGTDPTKTAYSFVRVKTGAALVDTPEYNHYFTKYSMNVDPSKLISSIDVEFLGCSDSSDPMRGVVNILGLTGETYDLASPENLKISNVENKRMTASWSSVESATSYRIDVATDVNFTNMVSGFNNKEVTSTTCDITGLNPNTQYYVRVRAAVTAGQSASSSAVTATTLDTHDGSYVKIPVFVAVPEDSDIPPAGTKYKFSIRSITSGAPMPLQAEIEIDAPTTKGIAGKNGYSKDDDNNPWTIQYSNDGTYKYEISQVKLQDDHTTYDSGKWYVTVRVTDGVAEIIDYQHNVEVAELNDNAFTLTLGNSVLYGKTEKDNGGSKSYENGITILTVGGNEATNVEHVDTAAVKSNFAIDFTKTFEAKGWIYVTTHPDGSAIGFVPDGTPQQTSEVLKWYYNGVYGVSVNRNGIFVEFDPWGNVETKDWNKKTVYLGDCQTITDMGKTLDGKHITLMTTDNKGMPEGLKVSGTDALGTKVYNLGLDKWPVDANNKANYVISYNTTTDDLVFDFEMTNGTHYQFKYHDPKAKFGTSSAYFVMGGNVRQGPIGPTYGITEVGKTRIAFESFDYEDSYNQYTDTTNVFQNKIKKQHVHDWKYTVEGNKIIAKCVGEKDCTVTDGKTNGVALTLSATDADYSGNAYTGASLGDTSAWTGAGLIVPTIKYVGRDGTTYEESETAPKNVGKYTAKIVAGSPEVSAIADFEIKKATPATPTDVKSMSPTTVGGTDGKITGVNNTMEYSDDGGNTWKPITGNEITGLRAGNYKVRIKETEVAFASESVNITVDDGQPAPVIDEGYTIKYDEGTLTPETDYEISLTPDGEPLPGGTKVTPGTNYYIRKKGDGTHSPSAWTEIKVPSRPDAPMGISSVGTSGADTSDGKITNVDGTMEYSDDGGNTWISITGSEVPNLPVGDYKVRKKATQTSFASESADVIVSYAIDYKNETIALGDDYEASTSNTEVKPPVDGKVIPGKTYYVRKKGTSDWTPVIAPERPAPPIGLIPTSPTSVEAHDGKISVVNETMEYSADGGNTWKPVTGDEIAGLPAGNYKVRKKANSTSFASESTDVIVGYGIDYEKETIAAGDEYEISTSETEVIPPEGGKLEPGKTYYVRKKGDDTHTPSAWKPIIIPERPEAPTGVISISPTSKGGSDGKLVGVDDTMEYSDDGGNTWKQITGTAVKDLKPGKYKVRKKATPTSLASEIVDVTILDAIVKAAREPETVFEDADTYKSEADYGTVFMHNKDNVNMIFDMKVHSVDATTKANQEFLAAAYAKNLGKRARIIITTGVYPRNRLTKTDIGTKKYLSYVNLEKKAQTVYAVCYNQDDKAYYLTGIMNANGTAVFPNFIARDATNITIFTLE